MRRLLIIAVAISLLPGIANAESYSSNFSRPFGSTASPFDGDRWSPSQGFGPNGHTGEDWTPDRGNTEVTIKSIAEGTVVFARIDPATAANPLAGWGFSILVRHQLPSGTYYSQYSHLTEAGITVRENQRVGKGQVLATVGTSGNSTGIHLHWAITQISPFRGVGDYRNLGIGYTTAFSGDQVTRTSYATSITYYRPSKFVADNANIRIAPVKPTLSAGRVSSDRVTLTWDKNTDGNFWRYRLYKSEQPDALESGEIIADITDANVTFYNDDGLRPDSRYYYVLQSVNRRGSEPSDGQLSADSEEVEVRTRLFGSDVYNLTNDPGVQVQADVDGPWVVWQDSRPHGVNDTSIMAKNLDSDPASPPLVVSAIAGSNEIKPVIHGNEVGWMSGSGSNMYRILIKNLQTDAIQSVPVSISIVGFDGMRYFDFDENNIVWQGSDGDIHLWNRTANTQTIVTQANDQAAPVIGGGKLYWQSSEWDPVRQKMTNRRVYQAPISNPNSFQPVESGALFQTTPAAFGDRLAFRGLGSTVQQGMSIFLLEEGQARNLHISGADRSYPDLSDNWLVFQQKPLNGSGQDIIGYNLSSQTELPLASDAGDQLWPQVSGRVVVWTDVKNNYDVMFTYL